MQDDWRGIEPRFLKKLDDEQRNFILTAVGRRFFWEFLCQHGKHLFIFGTTGGGKTQKGYWTINWLKHLETQIWFDTGKTNEILPLLCMDRKVRIILPKGCDISIEERREGKWQKIENHPEIIPVNSAIEALSSISLGSWDGTRHRIRDTITIISFRNFFSRRDMAITWVAEFFENLAEWCRLSKMPDIFPASLHVDESQWAIAGKRISGEGERNKASEIITENALELRSAGIRLVLYAQAYTNIPPAARENMLFNILCKGADVKSEENSNLSSWCGNAARAGYHSPMHYKPYQGRFVFENGGSYPLRDPWRFRLYPLKNEDRHWIKHLRVKYEGRFDRQTEENEIKEECLPELGRFSAMVIPPKKQDPISSRWDIICEDEI